MLFLSKPSFLNLPTTFTLPVLFQLYKKRKNKAEQTEKRGRKTKQ